MTKKQITKTEVVIRPPSGSCEMICLLAEDNLIYCNECDDACNADDWGTSEFFDVSTLTRLVPARKTYDFLRDNCPVVTAQVCPNCEFEHTSEPGDRWWPVEEDQFICPRDNEWWGVPHDALTCCCYCNGEPRNQDDCECVNMVQINQDGTPLLIDGLPMAYCECGQGRCDKIVCLICHGTYQRTEIEQARRHGHAELEKYEISYQPNAKPHQHVTIGSNVVLNGSEVRPAGASKVIWVPGKPEDSVVKPPHADCIICGTYCCQIHQTHMAKHPMCWLPEGKR